MPEYWNVTAMTGMRMSGKMSVGMPGRSGVPSRVRPPEQRQQQRENDERIGAPQRHLDNPHEGTTP